MKKTLLFVCVLITVTILIAAGCTRQAEKPAPEDPTAHPVPEPRSLALSVVTYGDLTVQGVFTDFDGVSDYALVSGGLLYVYQDTLWSTKFDGAHVAVETNLAPDRVKWYADVSASHHRMREQSDTLPEFMGEVSLSQGRYLNAEHLLAFSGQTDRRALFITEPGGEMRAVLRDANDLTLLGWIGRAVLVFYADLPG
ncbi:MAG TPA: hypothetical protein VK905_05170, partial [Bacillota bacterium]|nr:hypothetical protein [Bacillota bacterium]